MSNPLIEAGEQLQAAGAPVEVRAFDGSVAGQAAADKFLGGGMPVDRMTESVGSAIAADSERQARFDQLVRRIGKGHLREAYEDFVECHWANYGTLREAMVSDDLPYLLAAGTNKTFREAYLSIAQGWRDCFPVVSFPDFKTQKILTLTDLISNTYDNVSAVSDGKPWESGRIPEVPEGMKYDEARVDEKYEQATLKTYGCVFTLSRKMIVNDDLRSLRLVPQILGVAMARTLNYHVAKEVLAYNSGVGMTCIDTYSLFDATYHGNYNPTGTALTYDNLIAGYNLFVAMKTPGKRVLDLKPEWLLVPNILALKADQILNPNGGVLVSQSTGTALTPSRNQMAGLMKYAIIPELTDANDWYMMANPGLMPSIEVAFLNGREQPETFVQDPVNSLAAADGTMYKIRHDFAGYVANWRGIYRQAGQ